jgi:hypothetical protein
MKTTTKAALLGIAAFIAVVLGLIALLALIIYISYGSEGIVILPQILHQ